MPSFPASPGRRARTVRRRARNSMCCTSTSRRCPTSRPARRRRAWLPRPPSSSASRPCAPHRWWTMPAWPRSSTRCCRCCTRASVSAKRRTMRRCRRSSAFGRRAAPRCRSMRSARPCRRTSRRRTRPSGAGPRGPRPGAIRTARRCSPSRASTRRRSSTTSTCSGRPRASSRRRHAPAAWPACRSASTSTWPSRWTAAAPTPGATSTPSRWAPAWARHPTF